MTTPTAPDPANPAAAPPRLPNIGDVVWCGASPVREGHSVLTLPAIVVRVEEPSSPVSPLLLRVFTTSQVVGVNLVPHSDVPKANHWYWPTPAPAPVT